MQDISGFGTVVNLIASVTFPQGIEITSFADDADAVDSPSTQIADKGMGVNGDLVTWKKANAKTVTLNVIPNTDDDANLQVLARANSAVRGRRPVKDEITMTVSFPDGQKQRMLRGVITDAILGNSIAQAGRLKSKPYIFAFEDVQ